MTPLWDRQYLSALSTPSRWSLSWKTGRKSSRLVRAFRLRSHRHTTRAAATRDMSSMGKKKYHSLVMNLISAVIGRPSAVGVGLPIGCQNGGAGSRRDREKWRPAGFGGPPSQFVVGPYLPSTGN